MSSIVKLLVFPAVIFSCFLFLPEKYCRAEEPNNVSSCVQSTGGYCGVYCLYAASKFLGKEFDPNELIRPEYISTPSGSSLAELKKAAEKHGLYAIPVARLSTKDLRKLSLPVILHVKSSPTGKKYDHYELFLGSNQGKALIYDPPRPIELVEFRTIAPRWDGSGLIVSDKPINLNSIFATSRLRFAGYAGIAAAFVISIRCGRRRLYKLPKELTRKQSLLLSIGQCAALVLVSAAGAIAYNFINDNGMLIHSQASNSIQQAYQASFIPKVGEGKAGRLLAAQKAVFIDARQDNAFKAGHIENAINIPSYLTDDERVKATSQIDKNTKIIVYCQDTKCRQAENLAVKLTADGFSDVVIYKGKLERLTGDTK